jgi:guanylate kinase
MHKRIILVGRGGSGKDFLRKKLESRNFKYAVSYTTRPPREGETNGIDYFFISDETAQEMISKGEFFEYVKFNGWIYGTTMSQWLQKEDESVYIMTPTGLSHVNEEDRKECFVIYTNLHPDIIKERLMGRAMPGDSLERRIEADFKDFENFSNYDIQITNPDF